MGIGVVETTFLCDNQSAMCFAKNAVENSRSKHIDIKYHYVRNLVLENCFRMQYVPSERNVADGFPKGLVTGKFEAYREAILEPGKEKNVHDRYDDEKKGEIVSNKNFSSPEPYICRRTHGPKGNSRAVYMYY